MINKNISKLKIVELANVLAGPMVGTFFAEMGAKVLKVEYPGSGGDVTRSWKLPSEEAEAPFSAYYCSANYAKDRTMLDLDKEKDYEQFTEEVRSADIFITNYSPGSLDRLSVDYDRLVQINPNLIYGHILSFRDDPERPAYDVLLQAETGYLSMTGHPDGPMAKMPVALIDLLTGHQLKEGLLMALLDDEGGGSYVSVALDETAVASLANQATNWLMVGHNPGRMGTRHPNIAPYGDLYTSRDGVDFTLAIGSDHQFYEMLDVIGWPEAREQGYATNQERVIGRDRLNEKLRSRFSTWSFHDLYQKLLKRGVPIGEIREVKDVMQRKEYQKLILEEKLSKDYLSRRIISTIISYEKT